MNDPIWFAEYCWPIVVLHKGRHYTTRFPPDLTDAMTYVSKIPQHDQEALQRFVDEHRRQQDVIQEGLDEECFAVTIHHGEAHCDHADPEGLCLYSYDLERVPSAWPPGSGEDMPMIFTLDLDRDYFCVDNTCHLYRLPLDNVPSDWASILNAERCDGLKPGGDVLSRIQDHDNENASHIIGSEVEKYGASGAANENSRKETMSLRLSWMLENHSAAYVQAPATVAINSYRTLATSIVRPKCEDALEPGRRTALEFSKRLQSIWMLSLLLPSSIPSHLSGKDYLYREVIWATLQLALGAPIALSLQNHDWQEPRSVLAIRNSPIDRRARQEIVPRIFSNYHAKDTSIWHAPQDECFWFNNVLVQINSTIHHIDHAKAAIACLVERGRAEAPHTMSFDGLIISMAHVILVRAFADRHVHHTNILNISGVDTAKRVESCLIYARADSANDQDFTVNHVPNDPNTIGFDESIDGFAALANLFEAAARQRLKPKATSAPFPPEILCMILDHCNMATRIACHNSSRELRARSQRRLVLHNDGTELVERHGKLRFEGLSAKDMLDWVPVVGDTYGNRAMLLLRSIRTSVPELEESFEGEEDSGDTDG